MFKYIVLGAVILNLALFSSCGAMQAIYGGQALQKGTPSKTQAASLQAPPVERKVLNIVVGKIEEDAIYSKDGRKFEITGTTRVIDNSHRATPMRTAELFFEDGSLVEVVLK